MCGMLRNSTAAFAKDEAKMLFDQPEPASKVSDTNGGNLYRRTHHDPAQLLGEEEHCTRLTFSPESISGNTFDGALHSMCLASVPRRIRNIRSGVCIVFQWH
jgi:hypothetical protein